MVSQITPSVTATQYDMPAFTGVLTGLFYTLRVTATLNADPSLSASYDVLLKVTDCSSADFTDSTIVTIPPIEYNFH